MKRGAKVKCKGCGKLFKKSELNRHGYCKECGMNHYLKVVRQLMEKKGYYYEKWRRGLLMSLQKRKGKKKRE